LLGREPGGDEDLGEPEGHGPTEQVQFHGRQATLLAGVGSGSGGVRVKAVMPSMSSSSMEVSFAS
jgi:hypothetical protein